MRRNKRVLGLLLCAGLLTGCVERRYVIYTDPPGAVVLRNGQPIGATPVDDHFVYYGNYHYTIVKDGYETLQVDQVINTPWYEFFPLDFISENLTPWPIEDRREFRFKLEPRRIVNTADLLKDAQNLRNRGFSLGAGGAVAPSSGNAQQIPAAVPSPGGLPGNPPP
jgi:hypothetical protein